MIEFKISFYLGVTIIVLLSYVCEVKCCHTFGNVKAQLYPWKLPQYNSTIKGCIDPTTIDNPERSIRVRKVIIEYEYIPTLKRGTVQNLARLEEVKFFSCSIKNLKVESLRHLPSLKTVDLESNDIRTVTRMFQNLTSLTKIILDNNKISAIENEVFANLENLREIYVRFNRLTQLNGDWFLNLENIKSIYLDYNAIERIPSGVFENIKPIKRIHLSYNNISRIDRNAFNRIENLTNLDLSYNYIDYVDEFIFTDHINITYLNINANKLNFLPSKVLDRLYVENFAFDGNPWLCSCYNELISWLITRNVTAINSFYCNTNLVPVCTNPKVTSDGCMETYDEEATQFYFSVVNETNNNFLKRCIHIE